MDSYFSPCLTLVSESNVLNLEFRYHYLLVRPKNQSHFELWPQRCINYMYNVNKHMIGGSMNTTQNTQIKLVILTGIVLLLASCGTSKSTHQNISLSSTDTTAAPMGLAICNSRTTTDMAAHVSAYKYSNGTVDPSVIKLKFTSLSNEITQAGNTVRFFKWKVVQNQAVIEQTPLNITKYSLSTQQMDTQTTTAITATTISTSQGFYIDLNDTTLSHQVLKIAVYAANGSVLKQMDILIPEFKASPTDYMTNTDGSPRVQNLVNLHPLTGMDLTGWTAQNYTNFFSSKCF